MKEKKRKFSSPRLRRIKALLIKEFYQIIRDSSTILIAFIFPLTLLFIYGVGVTLDMNDLKVGAILEDTSPHAQKFLTSLKDSKYFSVEIARDKREIEKKIVSGKLRGMITIPFYFSRFLNEKDQVAPLYVVADGSETNTANFVQNYTGGVFNKWLVQEAIDKGEKKVSLISVDQRFWFNEELNSRHFLIPGSIAIIMTLIGSLLTSLVIAREWERGTIEALMSTPIKMSDLFISKIIAYFILGIASLIFCTIISVFLFGVPFRGSVFLLLGVSSVFLLTALGIGLFISAVTKNQFLASQLSLITAFLPAFMLSGFVFEISSMPFLIRLLTYIIPAKYMVSSLLSLFLVGNVYKLLIINTLIMALMVFILFFIIFKNAKKRLE